MEQKAIRKIANRVSNCRELKFKTDVPNTLTYLIASNPSPARVDIYCDTCTAVTQRIYDGQIRSIFNTNCNLKEIERILNSPPELSLMNLDKLQHDTSNSDTSSKSYDKYQIEEKESDKKYRLNNEMMLSIGETILAAESAALKKHLQSLIETSKSANMHFACSFPSEIMQEVENIFESNHSDTLVCAATNGKAAIFVFNSGRWEATSNIPKGLKEKLISHDSPPVYVSLGSKGRYYAAFLDGKKVWDGPDSMDFFFLKKPVRCVAFGRSVNDFLIVYEDGTWKNFGNLPRELHGHLHKDGKRLNNVRFVTLGANSEWCVRDMDGNIEWGGVTDFVSEIFETMEDTDKDLLFVDYGCANDTYFMIYQ